MILASDGSCFLLTHAVRARPTRVAQLSNRIVFMANVVEANLSVGSTLSASWRILG